ncbi:MAG: FtsX-like permease family protein [Eubacteriales bacterium]|nr:FtsX-like permease family protein [Eubacteriales bacterium]
MPARSNKLRSKRALFLDIRREFAKSITRFLSILIMIALGSFIFVGLYVTGPTMRKTVLTFVEKNNLQDLIVATPFGLESADKVLLAALPGVSVLDYNYRTDVLIQDTDRVVRLEGLSVLPGYELVSGRLPDKASEIALDAEMLTAGFALDDVIRFTPEQFGDEDVLEQFSFTVTGFVLSPEYLALDNKGSASIGNGKVHYFGVLLQESFNLENHSLARLQFDDVSGLDSYSDLYKTRMLAHVDELDQVFASRPEIRLKRYQREGLAEIISAEGDLTEAEQELVDARQKLLDARADLDQGLLDYEEGKTTFDQEIRDARAKIKDGEAELVEAKAKLDDGWSKLIDGEQELADGRKAYEEGKDELEEAEEQLEDGRAQLDAAQAEIDSQHQALDLQRVEVESGLQAINDGLAQAGLSTADDAVDSQILLVQGQISELDVQILVAEQVVQDAAQALVAAGYVPVSEDPLVMDDLAIEQAAAKLTADKDLLEEQLLELEAILADELATDEEKLAAESEIAAVEDQITVINSELTLLSNYQQAKATSAALVEAKANLTTLLTLLQNKSTLLAAQAQLDAGQAQLDQGQVELDAQMVLFNANYEDYEAGVAELAAARKKLDEGTAELADARAELEEGQAEYDQGLLDLEEARQTLAREQAKGLQELEDAYQDLLDGEKEYEEGLAEYNDQLPGAREDISEGKEEISDARRQLARLKVPDYTIQDRYKDPGFFQFIENSESMDFLSYIFPVFFFLIALLVSLTTMTRMVDEQRLQIGTLKALSYSNWDIVSKYLLYGSLPSLIGSLLGMVAGHKILMPTVFMAYSSNFIFTEAIPDLPVIYSILAVLISLLCTGLVALMTTYTSLRENVASLLRPKAPKAGTRILLERITPVWKRLSFHSKVTARNIFRFKKRMMMTILGVSGCAALIFMGFGIRDSIGSIIPKQYGDLFRYDTLVIYDDEADPADLNAYQELLNNDSRISQLYPARIEQGIIAVPGKLDQDITLVVPADAAQFTEINVLRSRILKQPLQLDQGAVISEKMALLLGLRAGDTLDYEDPDGRVHPITIGGVTENYTGHYLYLSIADYEDLFGKPYRPNSNYVVLNQQDPDMASSFSRTMLDQEIVFSSISSYSTSETVHKLMASMNIIVLVILIASSLLAIVVLYNLTNINVSERIRELSTIMVLGFYPKEVTAYVYRETMTLTAIGIVTGFGFGRVLHYFVISSMAPSNVLLDPYVWWSTYALAAAFTFAFSLVVMLIMHNRLKRVDMVSALKAVE